MSTPAIAAAFNGRTAVRVAVIGDAGTGKSTLITAVASGAFPATVPRVLPPVRLPADYFSECVPVVIIDTSASVESREKLVAEVRAADVVVLTYDCDRLVTVERVRSFWLPELRRLNMTSPVIVVGCKLDLREETGNLELLMSPIMKEFREVETCMECSALKDIQVAQVFYFAQKSVLHPTAPLFNQDTQSLQRRCVSALKRIFILCDHDADGALSDAELNDFQTKCFGAPLQPSEIAGVKKVVQEKMADGVDNNGLTLTGFLFLHAIFIEKGRLETTWTVLRKFGYTDNLEIREDLLPASILKCAPDQSVELTKEAMEFLKAIFLAFNTDNDEALKPAEIDDLFSTAPECPWSEDPYKNAAERNELGGLSLDGFLSQWVLMTRLDSVRSMANLIYIGYSGNPASAFHVTRRRRLDRKRQQSQRNVIQCFVFGPKGAGKSALLNALIGRMFSETYTPTTSERFASNFVELPGATGTRMTLVMREVPEDKVKTLLSNKESLGACDIAVFVHDSSDKKSWNMAVEMLTQVASCGERNRFEVPCLIVSAKDDLNQYPLAVEDSSRVSQEMGIEAPVPVSMKLRDLNNVFGRIITAAQHPHLGIPETEAGKSRKRFRRLVNRSLLLVSVGAAAAVVGLSAYRVYASRKNSTA